MNLNYLKLFILTLSLSIISCSDDDDGAPPTPEGQDTFEIIAQSPDHEILEQALVDTGLDQVLNEGVYTIFAPTDDAFSNVDLNGLSNEELANVLLYHVLVGETFAQSPGITQQPIFSTGYYKAAATENITGNDNPLDLYVNVVDNVVINGNSTVTVADLNANNGVVHVVDQVLTLPNITTFAVADPTFDNLEAALTRSDQPDFVGVLSTPNGTDPAPFTVFAPTNTAFGNLLAELGLNELADVPQQTLTNTLNSHVIAGANVRAADLTNGTVQSLEAELTIDADNATITDPNGRVSNIIVTDVQTANGVIHAIDKVILAQQ
ncbi:fasciclin domain-containing protein [Mesohalobacter halotolerans]|uniref:Fasciclin domain-containing protein n=1 Tax=Mesohalobacter halotolerans TaxID=1883405 RepID=A0A4V6ALF9_9FLAO|nr:fasciclin domain-containing protein [Mesohalobacter halotolerans]MBS3739538.1 fasciclin domain-containing protein [Psychroflexus sp.]TKS56615.1 fasciclin domain-containing protein [Mesohalobacter halotolerans]